MIKKLEWDSAFFKTSVYSSEIDKIEDLDGLKDFVKPCVLYLFLNAKDEELDKELENRGAICYDTRIVYHKKIDEASLCESGLEVREYEGAMTRDLEQLAYQAGTFSRFYSDARMRPFFKPLFKEWVINSLDKKIADKIFVYEESNEQKGFVSCAVKNGGGWLGLISVDAEIHRGGIGTSLLGAVERYYITRNIFDSYIVTQQENAGGCSFYETSGYKKLQQVFIYHWWFE